jgi:hypothetical protein
VKIKPTNAYKHLNIVNLLRVSVSATSVAILREMSLEGYITNKLPKSIHICKILHFKIYGMTYMFKYKIQISYMCVGSGSSFNITFS